MMEYDIEDLLNRDREYERFTPKFNCNSIWVKFKVGVGVAVLLGWLIIIPTYPVFG